MNAPQGSAAWHAERVGRITGSRIGTILGLNAYQDLAEVLRAMVREHHGAEAEFQGNHHTDRGHRLEPIAAALMEEREGWLLEESPLVVHPEHDWLAASPDRVSLDRTFGVEFKAPVKIRTLAEKPDYEAQIRLCMECCQIPVWHYVSYVEGEEPHVETLHHDPAWLPSILPQLQAFMDLYRQEIDNPAHLEPLVSTREDDAWAEAVEAWKAAKVAADKAAKAEKQAKQALVDLAGDRATEGCGARVQYVTRTGSVDWTKIADALEVDTALIEAHRKPSTRYAKVELCK